MKLFYLEGDARSTKLYYFFALGRKIPIPRMNWNFITPRTVDHIPGSIKPQVFDESVSGVRRFASLHLHDSHSAWPVCALVYGCIKMS